jgi:hypothetical protein
MKDYNRLARAVKCPQCGAKEGIKCFGASGSHVRYTHYARRNLAAKERHEQRDQ